MMSEVLLEAFGQPISFERPQVEKFYCLDNLTKVGLGLWPS